MTTEELLQEFVRLGGVITLYASKDQHAPIRFSLKFKGQTRQGVATDLKTVLEAIIEDDYRDSMDDEALAAIVGYDGPFF